MWNPTKNQTFWYHKIVYLVHAVGRMRLFNFRGKLKILNSFRGRILLKNDNKTNIEMNHVDDEDFQPKILLTHMFNVRFFDYNVLPTCQFYHETGHVITFFYII